MLRKKIRERLAVRIFLLTFLLLLGAGGLTFALIAWATPITYTAVISDRLQAQVDDLTQRLAQTDLADAGPLLDAFVRESGAEAALAAIDAEMEQNAADYQKLLELGQRREEAEAELEELYRLWESLAD